MQPNENITLLAGQELPLPLSCFAIGDDGRLVKRLLSRLAFRFSLDGILYHVAVMREDTGGAIEIWTDLGGTPYSAEGVARRTGIAAILQAAHGLQNLKLFTDKKQHLYLSARVTIGTYPITSQLILASVTMLLTQTKPWLDLLATCGLGKLSKPVA